MRPLLASPRDRVRPSATDRERAAEELRRAYADERLSVETFSGRLDLVYTARTRAELDYAVVDVGRRRAVRRAVLDAVAWVSALVRDLGGAWNSPRAATMVLPLRPRAVIGRSPSSDFVVSDGTVSAYHAILTYEDRAWTLRDNNSTNGTFVNGWRVTDGTEVRPGDELRMGRTRFLLLPPLG
jgi:hypothetical protein